MDPKELVTFKEFITELQALLARFYGDRHHVTIEEEGTAIRVNIRIVKK